MKTFNIIFISFALLMTVSCKKKKNVNAKVVIDCTGTYLNIGGSDYAVCNNELISHKKNGTEVTVTYKPSKLECTGQVKTCQTKHEHSGWIIIESIK